jgi:ABC-2 type transport system ATP-binding protein
MIEAYSLTKHFGSIHALNGVSFKVEEGEIVGLLGPNGSGKTTLMRILACFLTPTSGRAMVAGYDVNRDSLEVRRRLGYFMEKAPTYPDMRVASFLHFMTEMKGMPKRERNASVEKVLEILALGEVRNRIIGNLSKGFRQRVGLAQALVNDPQLLILDEPTIGLDPEQVYEFRRIIKGMSGQKTILLSTHILSEVTAVCDRVIIISKGNMLKMDSPENMGKLLAQTNEVCVCIEGKPEEVFPELEKVPGVLQVERRDCIDGSVYEYRVEMDKNADAVRDIGAVVWEHGWVLREIQHIDMDLEEIFLRMTRKGFQ